MTTNIKGKLVDGFGKPIANARMRAVATQTSVPIVGATAYAKTNYDGDYDFSLEIGSYAFSIWFGESGYQYVGNIDILQGTPDASLDQILVLPPSAQPMVLTKILQSLLDAELAADRALQASNDVSSTKNDIDTALSAFSGPATKFFLTVDAANAAIETIGTGEGVWIGDAANGGLWVKETAEATSLTKSSYDLLGLVTDNTDKKITVLSSSTAEYQNYLTGYGLSGRASWGGTFTASGIPSTATSFIIPCLPETNYSIIKSFNSDRFRIAEFEQYPKDGDTAYSYPKDEFVTGEVIKPDGSVEFSFKTGSKTAYLVVYTSRDTIPSGLMLTIKKKPNDISTNKISLSDAFYLKANEYGVADAINAYVLLEGVFVNNQDTSNSYSTIVMPVKPNTGYILMKSVKTNRFRIGEFEESPAGGDVSLSSVSTSHDNEENLEFITGAKTNFIAVYLSANSNLPDNFAISISIAINASQEMQDPRIVKGKNLFDPQSMYDSTGKLGIVGGAGSNSQIQDVTNEDPGNFSRTAIIKVKPNIQYTIQKSGSNRFRIGFCKTNPVVGTPVYIVKSDENDSKLVATVETLADTKYMIIVLSKNEPEPSFVQVEEGSTPTSKETFGFKLSPLAQAIGLRYEGFVHSGIGDGETDDTDILKAEILMSSGVISFDPNKTYLVSDTLEIDAARYHRLNGNGARFISASPDKPCFRLKGSMSAGQSASPDSNNKYARQQYGFVFDHAVIYGKDVGVGIGIEVSGCLAPSFTNNNIFFLDKGMVFKNVNRDVNLIGNRIWVNKTYGIEFHDSANIHQINIVSNIITYNKVNIIIDNADIYNIQITGNDIETATSRYLGTSGGANIVINAQTGLTEDVTVVGNTIEDHWVSDGMIVLNGANTSSIASVCIDGNSFGNSNDSEIKMGGCSGVYVGGQFKHSSGATIEATGSVDGLVMNVQSKKSGTKGGLFKCANASANLSNINISGSQLSGSARKAIDIVANQIKNFVINGNSLKDSNNTQAPIKIHAETIEALRVDMNNISDNVHSKAIEITATNVIGKNSMLFNSAKQGTFEAPDGFNKQGNW